MPPGVLVHAAALHADPCGSRPASLADAVPAADGVERRDQLVPAAQVALAVDGDGIALANSIPLYSALLGASMPEPRSCRRARAALQPDPRFRRPRARCARGCGPASRSPSCSAVIGILCFTAASDRRFAIVQPVGEEARIFQGETIASGIERHRGQLEAHSIAALPVAPSRRRRRRSAARRAPDASR